MKILAIETSCDETAAAVVESNSNSGVVVLGHEVASSEQMHVKTGGIVPEAAAREQLKSILPVIREAIVKVAKIDSEEGLLEWVLAEIDRVAVTVGPGLIGSLLVGVETAKVLALTWNKPLVAVNHLRGHVFANWIENRNLEGWWRAPKLPALGVIISGGHSEMVLINKVDEFEWIGGTRDDAAGECLDKCARILGLPYPGGPEIARRAAMYRKNVGKNEGKCLPRPMKDSSDFDWSFSGLKIAMTRELDQQLVNGKIQTDRVDELAFELEEAVVDILVTKMSRAVEAYNPVSVLIAGGVAANDRLREKLNEKLQRNRLDVRVPPTEFCTDNAAMIGAAAVFGNVAENVLEVKANPSLEITDELFTGKA